VIRSSRLSRAGCIKLCVVANHGLSPFHSAGTNDPKVRFRYLHLAMIWYEMAREAERKANCSSSSDDKAVVIFLKRFQKHSSAPSEPKAKQHWRDVQPEPIISPNLKMARSRTRRERPIAHSIRCRTLSGDFLPPQNPRELEPCNLRAGLSFSARPRRSLHNPPH
jgi:hypothetical protein